MATFVRFSLAVGTTKGGDHEGSPIVLRIDRIESVRPDDPERSCIVRMMSGDEHSLYMPFEDLIKKLHIREEFL